MPINEQLNFSVSFAGAVKASASTTINDTSRPAYDYILVSDTSSVTPITESNIPTYHLASNVSVANEGDSVTFTLTTTMLDSNTSIPYTITGISAADLSAGTLTGNFVIDSSGKDTISLTLANDMVTEGTETLTLTIDGKNISKSVTINDTSKLPYYKLLFDMYSTGDLELPVVNEGASIYVVVQTTNVPDGTVVAVSITGIDAVDVSDGILNFNLTLVNNIAYRPLTLTNDLRADGNKVATAVAKVNNVQVATTTVQIQDTSFITNTGYVFNSVTNNPAPAYEFRGVNTVSYSVNLGWGNVYPGPFGSVVTDDLYVDSTKLNILRVVNYYGSLGYEDYMGYVDIDTSTNVPNINTATVKLTDLSNDAVVFNKSAAIVSKNPLKLVVSGIQSTAFDIPVGVQLKLQLTTT